jgi:hypothetical protein
MANVKGRISLSVYDNNGGKGNFLTHVLVPEAQTLTQVNTALASTITAFQTVSTAGIKDATFSLISTAGAAAPAADASIPSGAVFDFNNATDPTLYGLWVPSFLDSLLGPGRAIDISAGVQAAFVASMVGAILGGNYTNAHYIANAAGTRAFRSARKLRR